jgi:hypothetical protein
MEVGRGDGFEHFTRSIFAQPEDLMAMFALYCDDSGTHSESPVAVAACFVAPVLQWEHFVKDWNAANERENFGVFHMGKFVAHQKQFALPEWQDEPKRDRTIKRLINIINTRRQHGFVAAVEKSAYDSEVPKHLRERFSLGNNHYTFVVRMCLGNVYQWRRKYGYKEPVQFVFDQMTKGSGEINAIFEHALEEGPEKALLHGISREVGWSFQSKSQVLPLQAADILAWESLHYMQRVFLPEIKEKSRKSYDAITETSTVRGYHNRESLRKLIEHLELAGVG